MVRGGIFHTCALHLNGAAYCWGGNEWGQIGNGTVTGNLEQAITSPAPVVGGLTFSSLSVGGFDACGLATDEQLYCWGNNSFGALGPNAGDRSATPVLFDTPLRFDKFSAGGLHVCGISNAGGTYCWGYAEYGQLGDGTTSNSSTPRLVVGTKTM